jgi:general stress protein 26
MAEPEARKRRYVSTIQGDGMSKLTLAEISEKLRDIDITMLSTRAEDGHIAGRPMSNNRDVDYDGDSHYFTLDSTNTVRDIQRDPKVSLAFQGSKGLLGGLPFMAAIEGTAELIRDKAAFKAHWNSDLDAWFEDGIDTPGLVLVKVHARRISYWDGMEEGELVL